MNRIVSVALPLAVFLGLAASAAIVAGRVLPARQAATMAQEPVDLPDVRLTDQHGRDAALVSELAGDDLLVVTFNYTSCQSICGVGNAIMQELDRTVAPQVERPVRLVSITINPTVDTPDILAGAAREWTPSERWLWTTGRPGDIDKVLRQANARSADIELHELVFIVGDGRRKDFRRMPVNDGTVSGIIAALDGYGR
ncbi:SCO family protein [Shinella sp.]|uniref:SCO family protein n=1 Tax=Shinella sp. TaxID=1870904 RepID=UPI00301C74DB